MLTVLFWILGTITIVLLFFFNFLWGRYNLFVVLRNEVKNGFSDIEIQLKRRASLIEKLMGIVREYAKHEETTYAGVAKARSAVDQSKNAGDAAKAEGIMSKSLMSLYSVVESNPKIKANENFTALQQELQKTENNIATYREEYNEIVKRYNNQVQTFPNLIAASIFQFNPEQLFSITQSEN